MTQITYTLADIEVVAEKVLPLLTHRVVVFKGGMGFGKTTLIKALVKALGSTDNVSSPTFSLVNPYEGTDSRIYHFDFYRLKTPEEAFDIGFEEYLFSGDWCFIEWAERVEKYLPEQYSVIELIQIDKNHRKLTINNRQIDKLTNQQIMYKYTLHFKRPAGTSRGVLTSKDTYFLVIERDGKRGIGECNLFRGLSADDVPDYEATLQWVQTHMHLGEEALLAQLTAFPSIQFGVEQAFRSVAAAQWYELFPSDFTAGKDAIAINGLIWMGTPDYMKTQIREKLAQGFRCIKMKIGAIAFDEEYHILKALRQEFSAEEVEIRVDANGAFTPSEAPEVLARLAELQLHSIEQPIKAGQWEAMAQLCHTSPLPIALDEELIGIFDSAQKKRLITEIKPQYIILKPSLIGGYRGSEEWIALAQAHQIGWWVTSALESNIGLNAIAQWTYTLHSTMPQGLGTGALYTNNLPFPLSVEGGQLRFNPSELVAFPFS